MTQDLGRVLITGANGHLGRRLLHRLADDRSARARAVVRSQRAAEILRRLPEPPETAVLDYRDVEQLAHAARGCHHCIHLVGIVKETTTSRYADAHEGASEALARAAQRAGLERIVYLSILGSDPASRNACLASKGRAEEILLRGKTPTAVLRLPLVLGPGDAAARVVRSEALARVLPLVAGGTSRTQPIFADDVVEASLRALSRPDLDGATLDLAGPESLSQRDLVLRAARLYGRRPRIVPIPFALAKLAAALAERLLANPALTRPMLEVVHRDDCIDVGPVCRRLGIELTPLDETLRRCVGPGAEAA